MSVAARADSERSILGGRPGADRGGRRRGSSRTSRRASWLQPGTSRRVSW